jgi:hypothetical protein
VSVPLGCIGLDVSDSSFDTLVAEVLPASVYMGTADGVEYRRWQDLSGARLVLGLEDGEVVDDLPSFHGRVGALLNHVEQANEDVAMVTVVDDAERLEMPTPVWLEQLPFLTAPVSARVAVAVTAFGCSVVVYRDVDEFERLTRHVRAAPEAYAANMYGLDPDELQARAWISGTVLSCEELVTQYTGQTFFAARVRTYGMTVTMCLASDAHPVAPEPGQIIGGGCCVVASIHALEPRAALPKGPPGRPRR